MQPSTDARKHRFDAAVAALRNGDWRQAHALATSLARELPSNDSVHFIAGAAALELQLPAAAVESLSRAIEIEPVRADYHAQLARALASVRRHADALTAADAALALAPRDPMTLDTLGVVYARLNEHAKAAHVFQRLVDACPRQPGYRFNLATSLVFTGNVAAAGNELETCLELDPHAWSAHAALAQLRKHTARDNHIGRLLAAVPEAQRAGAGTHVHMALAKEFEDLGEYAQSFEHLVTAKAIARAGKPYSSSRDEALFDALERNCRVAPPPAAPSRQDGDPIFVFGMPRSGTTLVDRILCSHSRVSSAGELENFGVAVKRASGSRTPAILDPDTILRSRQLDWSTVRNDYLSNTRPRDAVKFTDKLPQNFLYAWHIANALPTAKMICVRRSPMDTCLGNFRQLFARQSSYYDYSLDLLDIGRYYILFDRLMAHWERLMPGRILTVRYETLVDQQESCTRALLDACGLEWDEACLRFEQNPAPVATASALQVRQPLNRESVGRWKCYEPQLASLRRLLEGAGIPVDD